MSFAIKPQARPEASPCAPCVPQRHKFPALDGGKRLVHIGLRPGQIVGLKFKLGDPVVDQLPCSLFD